jgi:hypothetical protein
VGGGTDACGHQRVNLTADAHFTPYLHSYSGRGCERNGALVRVHIEVCSKSA